MCLIIHKPAAVSLPEELLASAAEFNPHGVGVMAFGDDGRLVARRRTDGGYRHLQRWHAEFAERECVLHMRYRTRGEIDLANTQPLRVTSNIWLVHNGTVDVGQHQAQRSDTWHLIDDYLRPILRRRPELLYERRFHDLILSWAGEHNRFVFMDAIQRRVVIVNREAGFELDGIWLSNTRWFDASRFDWYRRMQPVEAPRRPIAFSH